MKKTLLVAVLLAATTASAGLLDDSKQAASNLLGASGQFAGASLTFSKEVADNTGLTWSANKVVQVSVAAKDIAFDIGADMITFSVGMGNISWTYASKPAFEAAKSVLEEAIELGKPVVLSVYGVSKDMALEAGRGVSESGAHSATSAEETTGPSAAAKASVKMVVNVASTAGGTSVEVVMIPLRALKGLFDSTRIQ